MSTIRVDNFAPSAGGTEFGIKGIVKAVWFYDQTTPQIQESENVSSITDNGTGDHSVNLTNDMSSATFASAGSGVNTTAVNWSFAGIVVGGIDCYVYDAANSGVDISSTGQIVGDLA